MKFLIALILTVLLSFAGALFFDWWIIAVAAFVVAFVIPQQPLLAFLSGFLALFLLWGVQSFIIDSKNGHILSARIASVLPLGGSSTVLLFVTAMVAGLVGGLAALSGSFLRSTMVKRIVV